MNLRGTLSTAFTAATLTAGSGSYASSPSIWIEQVSGQVCKVTELEIGKEPEEICPSGPSPSSCHHPLRSQTDIVEGPVQVLLCDTDSKFSYTSLRNDGLYDEIIDVGYSKSGDGKPELYELDGASGSRFLTSMLETRDTSTSRGEEDQCLGERVGQASGLPTFTAVADTFLRLDWTDLRENPNQQGTAVINDQHDLSSVGNGYVDLILPEQAGDYSWSLTLSDGDIYRGDIRILSEEEIASVSDDLDGLQDVTETYIGVINRAKVFAKHELFQLAANTIQSHESQAVRDHPLLQSFLKGLDDIMCPDGGAN